MAEQNFLQSKSWAEFQKSQGRPFFEYDQDFVSAMIFKYPLRLGKNYLYIPYGPGLDLTQMLGGIKNPINKFLDFAVGLGRKEKAVFIKVEPAIDYVAQLLVEAGFKKAEKEIQPSKTLIVDLGKDEELLQNEMHHKTRYNIKVAEKHNIEVTESDDLNTFWQLIKKTSTRDRFSAHTKIYYQALLDFFKGGQSGPNEAGGEIITKIFMAGSRPSRPAAAAMILLHQGWGYYLHGASDYSQHSLMAPYKLHWEIIKNLKAGGYKNYDFWGIDTHRWPGITRFKLGWGGRVVEYPGSFDLPISKLWYLAYQVARKVF